MVQILPATGVPRRRGRFLDPKGAKEETVEPGLGDELEVEGWVGQVKRGAKRRVPVSTGVHAGPGSPRVRGRVPETWRCWGHEARRGSQGASRAAPGKSSPSLPAPNPSQNQSFPMSQLFT